MKVLITGATGLIGKEIVSLCHQNGMSVNYLTTSKHKIQSNDNYQGYYWNPRTGEIDANCINDVDAIINLVGASIAKRWTDKYKKEVIDSRVKTAELLIQTLKNNPHQIKKIVSASAIGIYADSQTNYYQEDSKELGDGFLTEVVSVWEATVDQFKTLGLEVNKIRIGLVLAENGGALQEMVKPIRMGAGSAFGDGKQWQSWIHISDLANIFLYALQNNVKDIINGVAPNPVTNKYLTKAIAVVVKKSLLLPNIPKFFMKLVLGEMHVLLFESQRVSSQKIEDSGFLFQYHHLESALEDLLK